MRLSAAFDAFTRNNPYLSLPPHAPSSAASVARIFAVGAAIGAALPHTETEDELLGETSDSAKEAVTAQASDAIAEGKAIASDAYDKAVAAASDVQDAVKDRVVDEVKTFKVRTGSGEHQQP